jgi:hypothetical protein
LFEIGQFQDGLWRVFALVFLHPASVSLKVLELYGMLARLLVVGRRQALFALTGL